MLTLLACAVLFQHPGEAPRLAAVRERLTNRLHVPASGAAVARIAVGLDEAYREHARTSTGRGRRAYVTCRDGWLSLKVPRLFQFLNSDSARTEIALEAPPADLEFVIETIAETAAQLRAAGVELLVVPIPDRMQVQPEVLVEMDDDESWRAASAGLTRFELRLLDAGVEVVDLVEPLALAAGALGAPDRERSFLRANDHWAPGGVVVTADVLSERLRQSGWLADLPGADGDARADRETRIVVEERSDADLGRLAPGAEVPTLRFERVVDAAGDPVPLKDRSSPVVLWGDSFTAIYQGEAADLGRQLHHRLGFALDVIASPGGGSYASRASFALRDEPLAGKRVVVWAFTAAALLEPAKWKPLDLTKKE